MINFKNLPALIFALEFGFLSGCVSSDYKQEQINSREIQLIKEDNFLRKRTTLIVNLNEDNHNERVTYLDENSDLKLDYLYVENEDGFSKHYSAFSRDSAEKAIISEANGEYIYYLRGISQDKNRQKKENY